jgi:drug efflux transport system ATP-binding protein
MNASHEPPLASAIELIEVTRLFPKAAAPALDRVSARVVEGQITGLVGPDGAGKTTLLRLMAGLLLPSEGRLRVGGLDPQRDAAQLRAILGYMPQRFGLYEDLTVLENLNLYADLRGVLGEARIAALEHLLEFTDLRSFTARPAGKLSGGMKQKLGLACVLLGSPRILLLDEPSVGVDPVSRRELWRMVTTLTQTGLTVVWSTSYFDEAERCADVLLMHGGRLAYAGPPQALSQHLAGRCLQLRDIGSSRREVLVRALRAKEVLDGVIQGKQLRLVLRPAAPPPPLDSLQAGPDARLVPVPPRLEDAFMDIVVHGTVGDSVLAAVMPRVTMDAASARAVIEAQALTKTFGKFVATDRISFSVAQGEIFGLLGPNGAGKSTTFRMLCGLLVPSAGTARVMGIDLRRHASRARQRLGYMAQKFSLYTNLTVLQNLRFFAGVYGLSRPRQAGKIRSMLDAFALEPYQAATPDSLPLGFRQRLALACAMMHDPEVLFLDEPTSGVDPVTRREFWSHINGVAQKGVTVMVTTHFMDEAEYCDRIGLVSQGELIAAGTPDDLKAQATSPDLPDPTMEDAFVTLVERSRSAGVGTTV